MGEMASLFGLLRYFNHCLGMKMDVLTYEVCPEGIQPSNMKNRDIY